MDLSKGQLREQLDDIHGVGPKIAESVFAYFTDPRTRKLLGKLLKLGVRTTASHSKNKAADEGPLKGLSFCITGVLSRPRAEMQERIAAAGGEVHERVKKGTTYLVTGDKTGKSKIDAAKKLGARLLDESELENLLSKG